MKKITVIFNTKYQALLIAILFVILAVKLKDSFSINIGPKNINTPTNATSPTSSNSPRGEAGTVSGLETKESNDGPISVAVTPRSLEEGVSLWDFDITLNTHSEELSEDLVAVSELVDDQGKSYKPTTWEGAPPGGHHRQGILKFNTISPRPKSIEIKMSKLSPSEIKKVGGISERNFKWNL